MPTGLSTASTPTAMSTAVVPVESSQSLPALLDAVLPVLSSPVDWFHSPPPSLVPSLLNQTRLLYWLTRHAAEKQLPPSTLLTTLPSLIVEEPFTSEQVWEQLQLLHQPLIHKTRQHHKQLQQQTRNHKDTHSDLDRHKERDGYRHKRKQEEEESGTNDDEDQQEDEDEQDHEDEEQQAEVEAPSSVASSSVPRAPSPPPVSVSDDAFFSLKDMEAFANRYEADGRGKRKKAKLTADEKAESADRDGDNDDEDNGDADTDTLDSEVDLDADVGDIDMEEGEHYADFFDPPTKQQLQGQNLRDLQRQEEAEEEEEDEQQGEEDEAGEEEDDEAEEEEDGEDLEADPTDEFKGYFARLSAHRRAKASAEQEAAEAARISTLSKFQQSQHSLANTISSIEQQLVSAKPWFHRGEITAIERPSDSLLQTPLQVEYAGKEKEIMTTAVNEDIESMIRQRVSEHMYDDVIRKSEKRKQVPLREEVDVSSKKNEKGLAQVYEEEYLAQKEAEAAEQQQQDGQPTSKKHKTKQELALEEQHAEIHSLFASLCTQLDALYNYHFQPTPQADLRVVRDAASANAMQREEISIDFDHAATSASVKELLPGKGEGEMVGQQERQKEEKRRRRRQRKERWKKKQQPAAGEAANAAALTAAAKQRNVSAGVTKGEVRFGKSVSFFQQLQNTVKQVEKDARREGFVVK